MIDRSLYESKRSDDIKKLFCEQCNRKVFGFCQNVFQYEILRKVKKF